MAAVYAFGAVAIHYYFVHALATGKIRGRYSTGWIEARESSPLLYWFYVAAFGLAVVLLDGYILYLAIRARRIRK